jgi:hypothetical protein
MGESGMTALMHAAAAGQLLVLRYLIETILATASSAAARGMASQARLLSLQKTAEGIGLRISQCGQMLDVESADAAAAGATEGLQITEVNGTAVDGKAQIIAAINTVPVGTTATLRVEHPAKGGGSASTLNLVHRGRRSLFTPLPVRCTLPIYGVNLQGGVFAYIRCAARVGQAGFRQRRRCS